MNGRYVLWCPEGEGVDEDESSRLERIQHRILKLFEGMELER